MKTATATNAASDQPHRGHCPDGHPDGRHRNTKPLAHVEREEGEDEGTARCVDQHPTKQYPELRWEIGDRPSGALDHA
jgi:hypothetical protein